MMKKTIMIILAIAGLLVMFLSVKALNKQNDFKQDCLSKNGLVVNTSNDMKFCLRPE